MDHGEGCSAVDSKIQDSYDTCQITHGDEMKNCG